jgi:hypothetical protein
LFFTDFSRDDIYSMVDSVDSTFRRRQRERQACSNSLEDTA